MDLAEAFAFCPRCGAARTGEGNPLRCSRCGFVHYFSPVVAVAAILADPAGRLVLITRGRDPGRGMLGMPGGFADAGESGEEAVRREVREEVGVEVDHLRYFASYPNRYDWNGVTIPVTDFYYTAQIATHQGLRPEEGEVTDIQIVSPEEVALERIAFPSMRRALQAYREARS